jgi:competence ComEA-like helix-hairpin-helix protein
VRFPQIFSESELRAILFLLVLTLVGETTVLIKRRHPGFLPDFVDVQAALRSGEIPDPGGEGETKGAAPGAGGAGVPGTESSMRVGAGAHDREAGEPADAGNASNAGGSWEAGAAPRQQNRDAAGVPLDPNLASAAELEALPGIGPALARRIVEDRAANGPFRTPDDLLRVRGIGPRLLDRIRPNLRFGRAGSPGS